MLLFKGDSLLQLMTRILIESKDCIECHDTMNYAEARVCNMWMGIQPASSKLEGCKISASYRSASKRLAEAFRSHLGIKAVCS